MYNLSNILTQDKFNSVHAFFRRVQLINHVLFLEWNAHHGFPNAGLYKTLAPSRNDGTNILFCQYSLLHKHTQAKGDLLRLGHQIMSESLKVVFIVTFIHLFPKQSHSSHLKTVPRTAMFTKTSHKSFELIVFRQRSRYMSFLAFKH